ncbi:MAG: hypothetical protein H7836_10725, partial [Magnetococcus sp. YQC-3]
LAKMVTVLRFITIVSIPCLVCFNINIKQNVFSLNRSDNNITFANGGDVIVNYQWLIGLPSRLENKNLVGSMSKGVNRYRKFDGVDVDDPETAVSLLMFGYKHRVFSYLLSASGITYDELADRVKEDEDMSKMASRLNIQGYGAPFTPDNFLIILSSQNSDARKELMDTGRRLANVVLQCLDVEGIDAAGEKDKNNHQYRADALERFKHSLNDLAVNMPSIGISDIDKQFDFSSFYTNNTLSCDQTSEKLTFIIIVDVQKKYWKVP